MKTTEALWVLVKRVGKLFLGATVFIMVVAGIYVAYTFGGSSQQSNTPPGATTTQPTAPASSASAPPTTPATHQSPVPKATLAIVRQAADATNETSIAALMSESEQVKIVDKYVAPDQRQQMLSDLQVSGKSLATYMGYPSVASANASATYYVQPQEFRVDKLTKSSATVSLYVYTHWVQADGSEFLVPGITIITMTKVGKTWYYTGAALPPANQQPPQKDGQTFKQADQAYQPYLKEFRNYE